MSIAPIIQAALKAKREKDAEERISCKKEYQAIFSKTIKSHDYLIYPEIKKMTAESQSLGKFLFESSLKPKARDTKLQLHFYPRHQKGKTEEKEVNEQLFKYHLEEFCYDIFQDEAILFTKLMVAGIWQNTAAYVDHTEKKLLREILLSRDSSQIIGDDYMLTLRTLTDLSNEFSLYLTLHEQGASYMFIGALCMALSLLFIFTPLPVLLSIFSAGCFVFLTSFALDCYGEYHLGPTLNAIKESIKMLPIMINSLEETDDQSSSSAEQSLL